MNQLFGLQHRGQSPRYTRDIQSEVFEGVEVIKVGLPLTS